MRFTRYIALWVALLPASVMAGPFGLEMGMTLEQLKKQFTVEEMSPGVYKTSSVPNPHPDLVFYRLAITPEHGLCKIMTGTGAVTTSAYGSELRGRYNSFKSALTAKYGEGAELDFLRSGSIWQEPRYWMMGLLKKERKLITFWAEKNKPTIDNLKSVMVEANAVNVETGFVTVGYEFENAGACLAAMQKAKNSSL